MPGALISASAMMMSYQDDWIGLGPNSDHAGTNEVIMYISSGITMEFYFRLNSQIRLMALFLQTIGIEWKLRR